MNRIRFKRYTWNTREISAGLLNAVCLGKRRSVISDYLEFVIIVIKRDGFPCALTKVNVSITCREVYCRELRNNVEIDDFKVNLFFCVLVVKIVSRIPYVFLRCRAY